MIDYPDLLAPDSFENHPACLSGDEVLVPKARPTFKRWTERVPGRHLRKQTAGGAWMANPCSPS